jgi:hypothetical protein
MVGHQHSSECADGAAAASKSADRPYVVAVHSLKAVL